MFGLLVVGFVFVVLLAVAVKAWFGDGRRDLRRCSRCWYDMSRVDGLKCPECGWGARKEAELFEPRRSKRVFRGCIATLSVSVVVFVFMALPGAWTDKIPRPVLRAMLSLWGTPPTMPAGGGAGGAIALPLPNAALKSSTSAWDRAVWQHQVGIALQAWADAVLGTDGPISDQELLRLVPMADEAHRMFAETGGLVWQSSTGYGHVKDRLVKARALAATDGHRLLRVEWALSELQYVGSGYSWRPDFARVPDELIMQSLAHADSQVRVFGIDRLGRRMHQVVMEESSPVPPGREQLELMADTDVSNAVRRRASDLVAYLQAFLPRGK